MGEANVQSAEVIAIPDGVSTSWMAAHFGITAKRVYDLLKGRGVKPVMRSSAPGQPNLYSTDVVGILREAVEKVRARRERAAETHKIESVVESETTAGSWAELQQLARRLARACEELGVEWMMIQGKDIEFRRTAVVKKVVEGKIDV